MLASQATLTDKNLYAYCDNNPVVRIDEEGELWITALIVGAGVGVLTQVAADFGIGLISGNSIEEIWNGLSPVDYVSAALSGALAATGISMAGSIVANAVLGGITYLANCNYRNEAISTGDLVIATIIGGTAGRIGGEGVNAEKLRGIYNTSEKMLNTAKSAKKIIQYTAKQSLVKTTIKTGVKNTVKAGAVSNVGNFIRKGFTASRV